MKLKPRRLVRSHRSDSFSVMLIKNLGRAIATFGRASENKRATSPAGLDRILTNVEHLRWLLR